MERLFSYREEWLTAATEELEALFTRHGYKVPEKIKVSCGWGAGSRGTSKKILGQCWAPEASTGGNHEIFIAPSVDEPVKALGVLIHELIHAVVGVKAGHGRPFKAACDKLGLEGKATQALPGAALNRWIAGELLPKLGRYPHDALNDAARPDKQGTRMIKVICPVLKDAKGKPYMLRMTRTWITLHGLPTSPAGVKMVEDGADDNEAGE